MTSTWLSPRIIIFDPGFAIFSYFFLICEKASGKTSNKMKRLINNHWLVLIDRIIIFDDIKCWNYQEFCLKKDIRDANSKKSPGPGFIKSFCSTSNNVYKVQGFVIFRKKGVYKIRREIFWKISSNARKWALPNNAYRALPLNNLISYEINIFWSNNSLPFRLKFTERNVITVMILIWMWIIFSSPQMITWLDVWEVSEATRRVWNEK